MQLLNISKLTCLVAATTALAGPAFAQPISGIYRLTPMGDPTMALDVVGSVSADGTAVQMASATQQANQQWWIQATNDGTGTYYIYAFSGQNSMEMLDSNGGAYGDAVHTWTDNRPNDNQLWYFVDLGNGYYRIIPEQSGSNGTLTLDIGEDGSSIVAGDTLDIWTYTGGSYQQFKLDWSGPSQILPNPKKGLPGRDFNAAGLNCSWVYNWTYGTPSDLPTGMEYVPMAWNNTDSVSSIVADDPGMMNILAFNEPDNSGQANMTVSLALSAFAPISALSSSGIGIGSPACADDSDSWMTSFMQQALVSPYDYTINFVALHNYPGSSQTYNDLLGYIDYIHSLYNLPIWVTEFAPAGVSNNTALGFVQGACQGMNSRSYVIRYSMFTSESPSDPTLGTSALINDDGTYTNVGQLYARM